MKALNNYFRTNITDNDHALYKVFIKHLKEEGTTIVQRGADNYILLNESKGKSISIGPKIMEIVDNSNVIMIVPHEHIREKMVTRTKEEIQLKIDVINSRIEIFKQNNIKKLL